jgi:ABC-type uncharacterized transport system substrate-binding protein
LLAADLVNRQLVAITTATCASSQKASKTIPIVFSIASDPVDFGLVVRLNKLVKTSRV